MININKNNSKLIIAKFEHAINSRELSSNIMYGGRG
jgi:hypothetical protein